MVGVPDYETYVEHCRVKHPGEPVMTYEEFSASVRTLATAMANSTAAAELIPIVRTFDPYQAQRLIKFIGFVS